MADDNAAELMRISDAMFSKKWQLDSLWQRLADEFYPERAEFTRTRTDGEEFAEFLFESTPAQYRRELAYAMGSLMRPPAKRWFKQIPKDDRGKTDAGLRWLDAATNVTRALIYASNSGFTRAMQEGDNDVIAFGNSVHSFTEGPLRDRGIMYDTHHLRDCAWMEDRHRRVNRLDRKMKVALRNLKETFPGVTLDSARTKLLEKDPGHEIDVRHVVLPVEMYDMYARIKKRDARTRFVSVYVDVERREILKEKPYSYFPYYVRRWALRQGSPYGYSPAAMLGLIDARVLQAQSRLLLDAGELSVRPPMLARDEVLGEASLYAGSIMWFSPEYEGRAEDVLRPVNLGQNVPIGLEMKTDTRQILAAAFFLNKLSLPSDKDMTAYEVGERISEYIRSIGPVVEPFEADNAGMLDATFDLGLRLGRYGDPRAIPPELKGVDLGYEFDTPIQLAYAKQKAMRARETVGFVAEVAAATQDPSHFDHLDLDVLTRTGARSLDGDAEWIRPIEQVMQGRQAKMQAQAQMLQAQQAEQTIAQMGAAADLVPKLAAANQQAPQLMDMTGGQQEDDVVFPDLEIEEAA